MRKGREGKKEEEREGFINEGKRGQREVGDP